MIKHIKKALRYISDCFKIENMSFFAPSYRPMEDHQKLEAQKKKQTEKSDRKKAKTKK